MREVGQPSREEEANNWNGQATTLVEEKVDEEEEKGDPTMKGINSEHVGAEEATTGSRQQMENGTSTNQEKEDSKTIMEY